MSEAKTKRANSKHFEMGNKCLLSVMGRHYLVQILEIADGKIMITFPGTDYPPDGMYVNMEFHDNAGYTTYGTTVLKGPRKMGDGIVLEAPNDPRRNEHRTTCRVATDLTVQTRDQIHARKYDAALVNLSTSGALIQSEAPFTFDTVVEMNMSLPGEKNLDMMAKIMHIAQDAGRDGVERRSFGIQFIAPDADTSDSINRYVWQRLEEIYPQR